jgi:hypothetical protein
MSCNWSEVIFWLDNLSYSFEIRIKAGNNELRLLRLKQRHVIPGFTLIAFGVGFLSLCYQERRKGKRMGCGEGRAGRDEATPCRLLETLDYPVVSQLVRGIAGGWGKDEKKDRKRSDFVLRTVALDPTSFSLSFFFFFFVHTLGARSIVD